MAGSVCQTKVCLFEFVEEYDGLSAERFYQGDTVFGQEEVVIKNLQHENDVDMKDREFNWALLYNNQPSVRL